MKSIMTLILAATLLMGCNNSATVSQPNDLDRTNNNDTSKVQGVDSSQIPTHDSTDRNTSANH